jgi:two-component system chemotaxis response regulator CheB
VTDPIGSKKIRVLVADDSALMRRTLSNLINGDPDLIVVGAARDGEDAVRKARDLRPDVVTMDINMPKLDGITALQILVDEGICPVIMVSSLTQRGAITTFEALELGAFDYVAKPEGTVSSNLSSVAAELISKLKCAAGAGALGKLKNRCHRGETAVPVFVFRGVPVSNPFGYKAVAMGISTGGPSTLTEVLPFLPADIPAAIFLVQHMPARFLPSFAERLNRACAISVVLAEPGISVQPGTCYVGKGDTQLAVLPRLDGHITIRTPTYPKTLFMPSVSVMMQSVHSAFGADTVGVLMTGIGDDGADMMAKIRLTGGRTIAESDETAIVFGMPKRAIDLGGADVIAPSYRIATVFSFEGVAGDEVVSQGGF